MERLRVTGYHRRLPHLVADEMGLFAAEGLEVDYHLTTFAPDHNKGMAEGKWDFTLSSADTMIARTTTDGTDYILFMQAEEGLSATLIGRPDITAISDLSGTVLAGDPGDSNLDLIRRKIMRVGGIGEDGYEVDIIGTSPKRLEALLEGKVCAAMLAPPSSQKALDAGCIALAEADDYVPGWPRTCGWGLRGWVESHRELVVRFIRAWEAASDWTLDPANREAALDLVMAAEGLNRDRAELAYRQLVPKARINEAAMQTVIDLRIELGVYAPPHSPPERFYDTSYWCEATGLPA
jgi:ABC-type nitrate/sulfonate/bicarbonate transport system substrate-binding protein